MLTCWNSFLFACTNSVKLFCFHFKSSLPSALISSFNHPSSIVWLSLLSFYKQSWRLYLKALLCFILDNTEATVVPHGKKQTKQKKQQQQQLNRDCCWGTLTLWLPSFYLLSHCAMISFAKAETLHIKLYSEHRLHPPCVLWKNPIIRLKVRETQQRSNQCHTLFCARVQCIPKSGSSAAIFRNQIKNYYHSRSLVRSLMWRLK